VRLVASQELGKRSEDWAPKTEAHQAVRNKLIKAATSQHPTKLKVAAGQHQEQTINISATKDVQTAAAEALANCVVPLDQAAALMTAVMRSKDEAIIAKALNTWASETVREQLEEASSDLREAVRAAAKAALEQLGAR